MDHKRHQAGINNGRCSAEGEINCRTATNPPPPSPEVIIIICVRDLFR